MAVNLSKIRVKVKGYDSAVVDKSAASIVETAINTGARVSGPVPLPSNRKVMAVNRSPHIYKTSMEHFQIQVHKRLVDIIQPTPKTIEALQQLQLPAGVGIEIK